MARGKTALYRRFKNYTTADLKACIYFLGNSKRMRTRAKEELEHRISHNVEGGE